MAASKRTIEKMLDERLKDHLFVVVSQAEPYQHDYVKDSVKVKRTTGGVVNANGTDPQIK